MENQYIKYLKIVIGMMLISLAIVISLQTELGVSPYDVLNQGLQITFGIPMEKIGYVSTVVGIILILIAATIKTFFDKNNKLSFIKNISFVAILIGFAMGMMTNFWFTFVNINPGSLLFAFSSVYIMSLGIAMIAKQKIIADPMTTLMMSMTDCGLSIILTRIILDGSMVLIGYLLGGTVGVCTVMFFLFLGVLIKLNLKYIKIL